MAQMRDLILGFWDDVEKALAQPIPDLTNWSQPNQIGHLLLCGMGGSGIAGSLIQKLWATEAHGIRSVTLMVHRDYQLPWIGGLWGVFLSSYSGQTEETLECAAEARSRGLPCMVFTSGGQLQEEAQKANWPVCILPSGRPPRACLGYSWFLQMRALRKLGVLQSDWWQALPELLKKFRQRQPLLDEDAQELAHHLAYRFLLLVTDDMLHPVAERWMQQLSENAKAFSHISYVPEMNHNELVGWQSLPDNTTVILLEHESQHPRVRLRYQFLRRYLEERSQPYVRVRSPEKTLLESYLYLIHLGDLLSDHLATRKGVDSMDITVLQELKRFLDEHRTET
ncbi:MAG: hypothetical protein N2110_05360 [Flavobacteriales bacterium]|nr:hypothetical protein [Flavobacteriales bacterium]MCX7768434.1 hypothetical protein [Flavobacteriales bacterium]MDW8409673.1 SIS domain-containing protein [Flavobacteriales bacterium]